MEVSNDIIAHSSVFFETNGEQLYGVWRSQIGLPRDTLTALIVIDEGPNIKSA